MKVYLLALSTDSTGMALWNSRAGIYDEIWQFAPFLDGNGNLVCGLADGTNTAYPFMSDIAACSQIDYVPIIP